MIVIFSAMEVAWSRRSSSNVLMAYSSAGFGCMSDCSHGAVDKGYCGLQSGVGGGAGIVMFLLWLAIEWLENSILVCDRSTPGRPVSMSRGHESYAVMAVLLP